MSTETSLTVHKTIQPDNIHKCCILMNTQYLIITSYDLTVFYVVNGEKFQSHALTLTLITQCPMSNSSELFSYATLCKSFKLINSLFF